MKKNGLQAIAQAAAKNIKTEDDLNVFRQMLTKLTVDTAVELDLKLTQDLHLKLTHLGWSDYDLNEFLLASLSLLFICCGVFKSIIVIAGFFIY